MVGYHTHNGVTIRLNGQLGWDVGIEKNALGQWCKFQTFSTRYEACVFLDSLAKIVLS
jgi:hypothetical protein